jgi:hypothetical protein
LGQGKDAKDADTPVKRQGDDRTDADVFRGLSHPLAVDADIAGFYQPLREGAALHQPDKEEKAIEAHALALEPGQHGKGILWPRCLGRAPARPALTAPGPRLAGRYKAHFGHQVADGRFVKAEAGRQGAVDRILAAMLADMVGMGGEPVGKIDAQPVGPEPPEGERRPARVGATVERRRRGGGEPRHGLVRPDRKQRAAPLLGRGLQQ